MKKTFLILAAVGSFILVNGHANAQYHNIVNFWGTTSPMGTWPEGSVIVIGDKLYGTVDSGGTSNEGVIFSVNKDGSGYTDLHDFSGTDGKNPSGTLTLVGKTLYGLTTYGGASNEGVLFSMDTAGSNFNTLYSFTAPPNPEYGALAFYKDKLYGTNSNGGINTDGAVFSYNIVTNTYTNIYSFTGNNLVNGETPLSQVIISGSKLYGTTFFGGIHNAGVVYTVDTNGNNYKDLVNGDSLSATLGYNLAAGVILSGNKLYGMMNAGGYYAGLVFSVDTDGTNYHDLLTFNGSSNGGFPNGSLIRSGNLLYGLTSLGGSSNAGTIFSIDTNGSEFTQIQQFTGTSTSAYYPNGDLTLSNGVLYGTSIFAGTFNDGVVFSDGICNLLKATHDSTSDDGNNDGAATVTPHGGPTPYTYLWSPGNQTTNTITGLSAGTYTCTISDYNGCSITTDVTVKTTTGINNISSSMGSISIYPNPSKGMFSISIMNNEQGIINVEVYNMLGEQVYSQFIPMESIRTIHNSQFSIDLSSQPSGVYLYRVITSNGDLLGQGKLVIQK